MKRLICFLLALFVVSGTAVFAAGEDAAVTFTFKASFMKEQGLNNFYFGSYAGGDFTELVLGADGVWRPEGETYPCINPHDTLIGYTTPGNSVDTGIKFVAPMRGMVRFSGKATMEGQSEKGNGAKVLIYKGDKLLWSKLITKGNGAEPDLDMIVAVNTKDEISFRVNSNGANPFDTVVWWPTVEYLDMEFQEEEGAGKFYQKCGDEMTELEYNPDRDGYVAADGLAFMSTSEAMPSEKYSLVRRYFVQEDGRWRIKGTVEALDDRGSGHILTVYRNGKTEWKQVCPKGEIGKYDVRMMVSAGDIIDVELDDLKYTGYNYAAWVCNAAEYLGTAPFCQTVSSAGHTNMVYDEFSLGSLIGTSLDGGSAYYSIKNDVRQDMTYNTSSKQWQAVNGSGAYISKTAISPGKYTDSVFETTLTKDGILRINGDMKGELGDGVVSKLYINDKLLWSSRVGGERAVRWDEPYDVSYFVNYVDVMSYVKAGDILKLTFNQWRKSGNDMVDISGVKLSYIGGETLSKTTKWKLENSIVFDTAENCVYKNGVKENLSIVQENGTNYMAKNDVERVFGSGVETAQTSKVINGIEYVPIRTAAEENDRNVIWAANRLVIAYEGIPVMYGYSELSEIEVALIGGGLFE